jgi:hypothetical protein
METLRMSQVERRRLVVMAQVALGKLSLVKASEVLSVSYRQSKRLWALYQAEGDRALVASAAWEVVEPSVFGGASGAGAGAVSGGVCRLWADVGGRVPGGGRPGGAGGDAAAVAEGGGAVVGPAAAARASTAAGAEGTVG